MGFQSFSVYVYPGLAPSDKSRMDAKEEVITTWVTRGLCVWMEVKRERVPFMAGSRRSFLLEVTCNFCVFCCVSFFGLCFDLFVYFLSRLAPL